jgi:ribonuclease HI
MSIPRGAHFLLFAEAFAGATQGNWRFVLSRIGAPERFAAAAAEPIACRERLELLAVVRGLEAIDEPARVTLVTNSRYVNRGLKRGLADWRASDWRWERFGQLVPVRDCDLWRRVDRALEFHELDCRLWRFDPSVEPAPTIASAHDEDHIPIKNLRPRSPLPALWHDALEPAELAAG